MHPDPFDPHQNLSDWPDCVLEVECSCSAGVKLYPVRMLLGMYRDRSFIKLTAALRCSACGSKPVALYLVAGMHRKPTGGPKGPL